MIKKTIVLFALVFGSITSLVLIAHGLRPINGLGGITSTDKIAVWAVTVILYIYYLSLEERPQLVPSMLAIVQENNWAQDKPAVTF